jgi:hypothetical protein
VPPKKNANYQSYGISIRHMWDVMNSQGWSLLDGINVLVTDSSLPFPPFEDKVRR